MKKYLIIGAVIVLALLSFWFVHEHKKGQVAGIKIVYVKTKGELGNQQDQPYITDSVPDPFICPENYASQQEYLNALAKFIATYKKTNPNATTGDMEAYRYALVASHNCDTTLEHMNETVIPSYSRLRFNEEDFGPQVLKYDNDTKVWSSYYTLNEQNLNDSGNPDEELVLNFYLKNVWKSKNVSVGNVAAMVVDGFPQGDGVSTILNKSWATDPITNKPVYMIFADTIYPDQNYGYVYITKISPIQSSVYSISYSKKFTGDAESIANNMEVWLKEDLNSDAGISTDIGNMGVDDSWVDYLLNMQNKPSGAV